MVRGDGAGAARVAAVVAVGLVATWIAGCGGDGGGAPAGGGAGTGGGGAAPGRVAADGAGKAAGVESLPADLFVADAPAGARGLRAVKAEAKEGDVVVLRAKVGGSVAPFVAGRAAMTVVDTEGLVSCEAMPDDHCPTPWDYCCEDPAKLVEGAATIQVVGADARPLRATLDGAGGLKPLRVVVVEGVVGPRPDPKVFVVNARRIHLAP